MKKILLFLLVIVVLIIGAFAFKTKMGQRITLKSDDPGFAFIELFTSEGCSSCPPADEAVADIRKEYADKKVLILSYHVDYWDRLGWKDSFSSNEFTSRQEYYAGIFNLNSIYTPQAILNGKKEFVGSDKTKLKNSINEELKIKSNSIIKIKAILNSSGKIEVVYSANGNFSMSDKLLLLLVQKSATSKIKRGENEGRTLHHINIVREISELPIPAKEQTTTFYLPSGLKKEDVFVAAFAQNKKSGMVSEIESAQLK